MEFKRGQIQGLVVRPVRKFVDERGWLAETFRHDEIEKQYQPQMSYVSLSIPNVTRGPHEHFEQSDLFVFLGPGNFKIWCWDNRKSSPTFGYRQVMFGGQDNPLSVLIPPGIVHAYRNISPDYSLVMNFPNRMFMGEGRKSPIDEIRHEDDPDTPFKAE